MRNMNFSDLNSSGSKRKLFRGGGELENFESMKRRKVSAKINLECTTLFMSGTNDLAGLSSETACSLGKSESETNLMASQGLGQPH